MKLDINRTDTMPPQIVVVGSINTDFMGRGPMLPLPGQSVMGEEFAICPGGKGANQALAAARLGGRVALVAATGDDERADASLAALRAGGVDLRWAAQRPGMMSGAVLIQIDAAGQKQILSIDNANGSLDAATVQAASAVLRQARVVIVPVSVPMDAVRAALEIAGAGGAKVFLDPARPEQLPDEILARAWVVKPNRHEAEALTGVAVTDRASARAAAHLLLGRGVHLAAVEAGDSGNLLVSAEGECWLPRLPVASVDATGAGDAFMAALAVAFVDGLGWEDAGWLASAAAALTTTALGAQTALHDRAQVEQLIAAYRSRLSNDSSQT